jgi:hypothetical protein
MPCHGGRPEPPGRVPAPAAAAAVPAAAPRTADPVVSGVLRGVPRAAELLAFTPVVTPPDVPVWTCVTADVCVGVLSGAVLAAPVEVADAAAPFTRDAAPLVPFAPALLILPVPDPAVRPAGAPLVLPAA